MKYCHNCNVFVLKENDKCHLCNGELVSKVKQENYPLIVRTKVNKRLDETTFSIMVLIEFILFIINILTFNTISSYWSVLTLILGVIFYLILKFTFFSYKSMSIKLLLIQIISSAIFIFLDIFLSLESIKYWSFTYVVPFSSIIFLIVSGIIVVSRKEAYKEYFGNFMVQIFILTTPLVLYFTHPHLIKSVYPSIVCFIIAVMTFILLNILPSKETKEEIKKRIHI